MVALVQEVRCSHVQFTEWERPIPVIVTRQWDVFRVTNDFLPISAESHLLSEALSHFAMACEVIYLRLRQSSKMTDQQASHFAYLEYHFEVSIPD